VNRWVMNRVVRAPARKFIESAQGQPVLASRRSAFRAHELKLL
jgi:hypothetical protein